jgi:hypothetical protein
MGSKGCEFAGMRRSYKGKECSDLQRTRIKQLVTTMKWNGK